MLKAQVLYSGDVEVHAQELLVILTNLMSPIVQKACVKLILMAWLHLYVQYEHSRRLLHER